jgi:MFS transporter, ACS family, aldohexuronate transporter
MPNVSIGRYRWTICSLLFFATTINYMDRQVIGLLKHTLTGTFHWNDTTFGTINGIFQFFYAFGLLFFGAIIDRVGTKVGYAVSIIGWSLSSMGHALAGNTLGFTVARSALGLSEAGNFPSAIKAVAEWFPKKERALATGIFNSGANIGAVVAPIMVPLVLAAYGWQMCFIVTGALGLIWLIFWLFMYDIPSRKRNLKKTEYEHIHCDESGVAPSTVGSRVPWRKLLAVRQTWAFVFGKFLTDPVWWFYLFWLNGYFHDVFHTPDNKITWPIVVIYSCTTIGSIGGGFLSGYLINKGWPVYKARKRVMFIFALLVVPVISAGYLSNMWLITAVIGLAAAAHQAWSANIFTTASDMFPKKAVSSITGIGGMAGSIGGIIFQPAVGVLLDYFAKHNDKTMGYTIVFLICGSAYLLAWLLMHLFAPKQTQVVLD